MGKKELEKILMGMDRDSINAEKEKLLNEMRVSDKLHYQMQIIDTEYLTRKYGYG